MPVSRLAFGLLTTAILPAQEWGLRATATTPAAAMGAAMAYDSVNDRLVLFGGKLLPSGWPNTFYQDTWLFDGVDWSRGVPTQQPSARAHHSMAATSDRYTALQRRVFLFGGVDANGSPLNDLWTWDGSEWTFHPNAVQPAPRFMASMTSYGRGVVLYGGQAGQPANYLDDTWAWSFGQWSPGGVGPSGRHSAAMAEGNNLKVTLHGGRDATRSWIDETWQFGNGSWQLLPIAGSPGREAHVVVHDRAIARSYLVGGLDNGARMSDVWRLDSTGWEDITPTGPGPRAVSYAAGALDSLRHRVFVFGGEHQTGVSNELWEFGSTFPVETFGVPCAVRGALPQLSAGAPLLGSNWALSVSSASYVPNAVLSIGFDDQSWNGSALPASLAGVGLPGCSLRIAPIANRLLVGSVNTVAISTFLVIPDVPDLIGFSLFAQAGILDASGPSAVTSAVRATIY